MPYMGPTQQGTEDQGLHILLPSEGTSVDMQLSENSLLQPVGIPQEASGTHTRSRCTIRPTQCYADSLEQREQGFVAWEILMDQDDSKKTPTSEHQYDMQEKMNDPITFVTSMNLDILYMHQAMQPPD